jgi:hypothetical protein
VSGSIERGKSTEIAQWYRESVDSIKCEVNGQKYTIFGSQLPEKLQRGTSSANAAVVIFDDNGVHCSEGYGSVSGDLEYQAPRFSVVFVALILILLFLFTQFKRRAFRSG